MRRGWHLDTRCSVGHYYYIFELIRWFSVESLTIQSYLILRMMSYFCKWCISPGFEVKSEDIIIIYNKRLNIVIVVVVVVAVVGCVP
jgi:hypothetical protein